MPPRKQPWFRFYVEAIWDRKIRRLSTAHRWLWVTVLATAKQSPLAGYLWVADGTPMTESDLADAAAIRLADVRTGLKEFETLGLIETDPHLLGWRITKWNERQFESDDTAERTAKHRSNVVASNGDVTPPENREQKTNTEPDTEKPLRARASRIPEGWRPTPQLIDWVSKEFPTVDLILETEKFIDHFSANGKPMKDWDAAWRNWMRRTSEFQGSRR